MIKISSPTLSFTKKSCCPATISKKKLVLSEENRWIYTVHSNVFIQNQKRSLKYEGRSDTATPAGLGPFVRKVDKFAIRWISPYPVDKFYPE